MLNRNLLLFCTLMIGVCFLSCQKAVTFDNAGPGGAVIPPGGGGVTGSFTAKIDGASFIANKVATADRESGVIALYGLNIDKKSIILRVADSGVHNYSFDVNSMGNFAAYEDSSITPIAAFATNQWPDDGNYGNLNITAIDTARKTMSGTFSIRVYRSLDDLQRTITEGTFTNISYASSGAPQVNSTDSFKVKIDGVDFAYTILAGIKTFGLISISASNSSGFPTVGISVPDDVVPGTHAFSIVSFIGQYNQSNSVMLSADTGHITILEHNTATKRIRGRFNFLANQTFTNAPPDIQLTEGYFSLKYN